MKQAIWILWPSFVVAAAAEAIFFTVFDPMELQVFGAPVEASRLAVYSIGFLVLWAFAAASSALTCLLQRPSGYVDRKEGQDAIR